MNRAAQKKDTISHESARVSPEIISEKRTTKIEPLQGWLEARYKRCGKANCKCAKGELHGPYYLRRWKRRGERYAKHVKKRDVSVAFSACLAYKRDKQETRELIRQIKETGNRMLKALGAVIKSWS